MLSGASLVTPVPPSSDMLYNATSSGCSINFVSVRPLRFIDSGGKPLPISGRISPAPTGGSQVLEDTNGE